MGMITVPFEREKGLLIVNRAVGGVRTRAIIDTGGQASIGNVALRDAAAAAAHRSRRSATT